jgi:hypothetical protein
VYAGTASGDVLKVNIRTKLFKHIGPKTRMPQGVVSMTETPSGELLVGGGDGTISVFDDSSLKVSQPQSYAPSPKRAAWMKPRPCAPSREALVASHALHLGPSTLNPQPSTLNLELVASHALHLGPETLNPQPSTLNWWHHMPYT